jgi:hypothetical protein
MGLIIQIYSASTPMDPPWWIRYKKDKASIRGAIVPRVVLKRIKEVFRKFSLTPYLSS